LAKKWAIQFNPQKTKNIVFSRRDREHPPVYFGLNGDEIDETDNHCHLTITFQSSKTGLINAKYIRIREYLSNKCLTCLSKSKREHAF
jgi:hypothetical protein